MGQIVSAVETQRRDRIVGLYSQAHNLAIGGDYAQALELYDRIIADVPGLMLETPQINYERALCLKALRRIEEAEQAIRSCLNVRSDDQEFLRFLSEIQSSNETIDASRESKVKPAPASVEKAEEADQLYVEVRTLLPLVEQADVERALRAISLIEEQIVGRACGRVRNKLLNYLSIVQFARATGSKTVDSIEIGTLFGGSCLAKLFAMRDLGVEGKVVCIDPMSGFYDQTRDPQTGLAVTGAVFFENIERFGFTKEAVDLREVKSSDPRAAEGLREKSFATLLIDGDHSYRGVRYDWENYYRFVQPGGIVLFDDYSEPEWPDITVFANELIDSLPDGWRKLGHLGTTLLLSRPPRRTKQVSQEPRAPKAAQTKFLARAGALKKEENLLAILDPAVISRRVDLIDELAQCGINHLTKSPALGWNYVLDHVWITEEIERYLSENRRRDLTVLDVGCGRTKFHNFLEKKFGVNIIGIDRPQGYCHQAKLENADYYADFLELDVFPENSVDIIFWLSAIEHNEKEKIRQLFQKSMSLLKEGGLFLATFAISKNTHWFEQSEQTNLSLEDSMNVFEEAKVDGNFDKIREKYRQNFLFLRDKYERRYERFDSSHPDFVVGAVKKIKAKRCIVDSPTQTITIEASSRLSNQIREKVERCGIIPRQQKALAESNLRLAEFKDKHRGQRCVIIGNGPSLNKMDLSFLRNEITFGMNRIYLLFDKWDFRPTYYVSVNPLVIEQSVEQINKITAPRFLTLEGLPFIGTAVENIFIQRRPGGAHFSTDPRKGCWWPTVTYAAMQLAYFMGFNEVILIGVDHYFRTKGAPNKEIVSQGTDENHFHPDYFGKGVRWQLPDLEKSEVAYRLAKQAFEADGRRIIDATVEGHLTIFPKTDYREIFFPAAHPVKTVKAGLSAELVDTEFEEYFRNRSESTEPLVTTASAKFSPLDSAEPQERYLVSALVSTYNSERFFRGCLEDLEHQTIADRLEIIVVNSGSQQNEEAIVKEFQQKYDNIVYIKTEQREGIYAAWNRAVKAARAKFITNANTDDQHREDALEIMARTLRGNPDVALVYGDQICTDTPNGTFASHHATEMAKRPDYSRARLLFGCCVGSQPMWRKSLHDELGYFDESLDCAADWDFWIRISRKYRFLRIPEFLGLYYYNKQGIEHGREIHSLYERYIVGRRYGTEYIAVIPYYRPSASDPLVSVIMTVYNCAEYIGEAIESVLIQNYPKFELVIINDGSTDNTKEVISRYDDERIRYIYQENGGMSNALNRAVREAKGQYIMPLDSDDMMTPDFIASHLQEFKKHPEADLVYSDVLLIDSSSNPIRVMKKPEYQNRRHMIRDLFRAGHPIIPFRLGIRKSVYDKIGLYDETLRIGMDYDMIRRFVKAGLKEHHLRKTLHLRRILPQSLSRSVNIDKARDHFEVVKRFTNTFSYDELFPDVAWDKIPTKLRQLHAKCLAAVTCLAIGQAYVKNNSLNYARTAFGLACSELNSCLQTDPGNMRVRQLLKKSEFARSRCSESAPQAAC